MKARAFVIRGQYGWFTSAGMDALCLKLQAIPGLYASIYNWNEDQYILDAVDKTPIDAKMMMLGFSLGAHTCTRIPTYRKHRIFELIIGFDPSRLARLWPVPNNVLKAICFYNPGAWFFGGAKYVGNNVTLIPIRSPHLLVDWNSAYWSTAIDAVKKAMGPDASV